MTKKTLEEQTMPSSPAIEKKSPALKEEADMLVYMEMPADISKAVKEEARAIWLELREVTAEALRAQAQGQQARDIAPR